MSQSKSIVTNLRITPDEEQELTDRFGSPGKALRHSVNMIMADRKVRVPDPQFLIFADGMVEVDSIASVQPSEKPLLMADEDYVPKVCVLLHAGVQIVLKVSYEEFLAELAKARLAE